jgi:hypothetical protein
MRKTVVRTLTLVETTKSDLHQTKTIQHPNRMAKKVQKGVGKRQKVLRKASRTNPLANDFT